MDRKEITAFLIDCDPAEFLVYRDEGELGTVVVGPDGKKYRFSNEELDLVVIRMRDKELDKGDKIREEKEAEKEAAVVEPVAKIDPKLVAKKKAPVKRAASTLSKKKRVKKPTARKSA